MKHTHDPFLFPIPADTNCPACPRYYDKDGKRVPYLRKSENEFGPEERR